MKKTTLSTRDALLQLRTIVSADAEKAEKIETLVRELNATVSARSEALEAALGTLEGYVTLHSEMHGFNADLEELAASATRQTRVAKKAQKGVAASATRQTKATKATKAAKAAKKQKQVQSGGRNGGPQKATGYPGELAESISLSTREQEFVDLLSARWPTFVTPQTLVRKGIIPKPNHVTAKVNQLRKKGVPIESAKQARASNPELSTKTRGYRLIA